MTKTPEEKRRYHKEWRDQNRDRVRENQRRANGNYYTHHREQLLADRRKSGYMKAYYQENREDICEQYRKKYKENPDVFRERSRRAYAAAEDDPVQLARRLVASCKTRAQKRGIKFNLDEYLPEITTRFEKGRCELSGIALIRSRGGNNFNSFSIDRIKPHRGYVYENIRIVAWGLNAAFGHWGEDRTALLMRRWLDRRELI